MLALTGQGDRCRDRSARCLAVLPGLPVLPGACQVCQCCLPVLPGACQCCLPGLPVLPARCRDRSA